MNSASTGVVRRFLTPGELTGVMLIIPASAFLLIVFVYPLFDILYLSVSEPNFGFENFEEFFGTPFYLMILGRTFMMAFQVTVLTLLLSYPLAYVVARVGGVLAAILIAAVTIGFWTSYLVRAFSWLVILGKNGPVIGVMDWLGIEPAPQILFNTFSTMLALVHALTPYMVLVIYAVMRRIDTDHLRAAASLGASPIQAFLRVYLPLSMPGVVNGCTLVFIITLGFYVTPVLLGGPQDQMIAGFIGEQIRELLEWGPAAAMAMVLLVSTLIVLVIYNRFVGLDRLWG